MSRSDPRSGLYLLVLIQSPLVSMQHGVLFQDTLGDEALSTLSAHMLPLLTAGLAMHGDHMVC